MTDFNADLAANEHSIRKLMRAFLASVTLVGGGVVGWAATTRIDSAVVVSGTFDVKSNAQAIQHPEGGVVGAILVHEGELVKEGQVLDSPRRRESRQRHQHRRAQAHRPRRRAGAARGGAEGRGHDRHSGAPRRGPKGDRDAADEHQRPAESPGRKALGAGESAGAARRTPYADRDADPRAFRTAQGRAGRDGAGRRRSRRTSGCWTKRG